MLLSRLRHRGTAALLAAAMFVSQTCVATAEASQDRQDLRDYLSDPQEEWWDIGGNKALLCGRRAGKSILLSYWLVDGAIDAPTNSICCYISLTRKSAEENLWLPIKEAAKKSGVPHKINEAKLQITFQGGGRVILGGCDNKREIEKYRGKAIIRAAVDECGSIKPSDLRYLHHDVLRPATMDHKGQLAFAGTPGPTCNGYWWEMTREDSEMGVPCKRWTAVENPYIEDVQAFFDATLDESGWTLETPTFIREYLGKWIQDVGELVFPVDEGKDGELGKNKVGQLPVANSKGHLLSSQGWRYAIGVDVGVVDAIAISVVACHPDLPKREFILSTEKHTKWLIDQLAVRLRELKKIYPNAGIVIDIGGMGKSHSEELTRRFAISHEGAEKTDKASQVRIVRDGLISGRIQVLVDGTDCNDALLGEWAIMGWDDKREKPHTAAEDHASDATLYALRRLRHYSKNEPAPPPVPGSKEAADAEAKRMFEARQRQMADKAKNKGKTQWRT